MPGCGAPFLAKELCRKHYNRQRTHGDPNIVLRDLSGPKVCTIDQCTKAVIAKGLCGKHYQRKRTHGDPLTRLLLVQDAVCSVDQCDSGTYAKNMCRVHYTRHAKHGDPSVVLAPGPYSVLTYKGAHDRIRAARGKASERSCVDCGGAAYQWSYDHSDPNELVSDMEPSVGYRYSLDVKRYQPRCVPCHKRFDS